MPPRVGTGEMVVNRYLRSLRLAVTGQASAYGFTLVVWGTGALAIDELGRPGPVEVFAYVGGVLVAAVLIVVGAFGLSGSLREDAAERRAHSAVHLMSVPLAMLGGWAGTLVVRGWLGYLMAGFVAAVVYEALVSVEIVVALVRSPRPGRPTSRVRGRARIAVRVHRPRRRRRVARRSGSAAGSGASRARSG